MKYSGGQINLKEDPSTISEQKNTQEGLYIFPQNGWRTTPLYLSSREEKPYSTSQ